MKKKVEGFVSVKEALRESFFSGMRLGISLGGLPSVLTPKIAGQHDTKKIAEIIDKEIARVFEEFKLGKAKR